MPKKISIKTVDGNRYDYIDHNDSSATPYRLYKKDWCGVPDGSTTRWFYIPNIVSITETEIENGETN